MSSSCTTHGIVSFQNTQWSWEESRRFPSREVRSQSPGVILDPSVPFTSQGLSMLVQAALVQNLSQMHLVSTSIAKTLGQTPITSYPDYCLRLLTLLQGSLVVSTPPIHLPNNRINIPTKHKSDHIIPMWETLHPKVKFLAVVENSVSPSSPCVFSHLLTTWNSDRLCSSGIKFILLAYTLPPAHFSYIFPLLLPHFLF